MIRIVEVKFWDGLVHRVEIMPDTDIYVATLQALSDLAHKGIYKDMLDIMEVSIDIFPSQIQ